MQKQLFGSELGTPKLGIVGESGIRSDSRMNELMLLVCCLVTLVVSVISEFAQEKPVFLWVQDDLGWCLCSAAGSCVFSGRSVSLRRANAPPLPQLHTSRWLRVNEVVYVKSLALFLTEHLSQ